MVACRVWLSAKAPGPARVFAKRTALATVAVSIVGNAAGHLAATGHLSQGLVLVVLVGAVPPAGLAAAIHLAVLRGKVSVPDAAPVPAKKPKPAVAPAEKPAAKKTAPKNTVAKPSPPQDEAVDDFDMQRARHANRDYGAENDGKTITRDALKAALAPCGTTKATALLAALKKEREAA
jgi:hypothetical protein